MDPQTALEGLRAARNGDLEAYREQLADLLSWYDMGGWMPDGVTVGVDDRDGMRYRYFNWNGLNFTWWGIRGYF